MDALRSAEGPAVADVLREVENQPAVSITGFESTAKDPVSAEAVLMRELKGAADG